MRLKAWSEDGEHSLEGGDGRCQYRNLELKDDDELQGGWRQVLILRLDHRTMWKGP